jgi:putative MATE family efflux protein
LLIGNIFQQFYNVAATLIVGRFVGQSAFAALGVAGTVMNLYVFILNGCCIGICVILASLFGSGDFVSMRREVFLAVTFGTLFTMALSALSISSLPLVLRWIRTPPEITPYIEQYLNIILGGLIVTFLYNLCAAMLRAVGDTRSALVFLIVAVVFNAALTFVSVVPLNFGIAGAAWATVFSQLLSAILCIRYIKRKFSFFVVKRIDMRFDGALLKKTAKYALISALHQSSLYIGKVMVQGIVNTLGTAVIAAYTAAGRTEDLANAFGNSGSEALSIFIAHHTGAGEHRLARRGFFVGCALLSAPGVLISVSMFLFAVPCVAFFLTGDNGASMSLEDGVSYLRVISCFYILNPIANSFVGYFRGCGKVNIPFIGTTLHISLRVLFSFLLARSLGLKSVAFATGIGWIAVVLFQLIVFYRGLHNHELQKG